MSRHHRHPSTSGNPSLRSSTEPSSMHHQPTYFQRTIVWLFHLLVLTTPLFFTFNTDELFEFNKMILTYCYAIVIVAVWIGRMIHEKRLIWRHTVLDYAIGIFLLSQFVSTIFSIHPYTSWLGYYSRFHGGLASQLTYALLYWAFVSNVRRRDLHPLAISTIGAGVLVSLYAIGEHFGHSVSCWLTSGGTSFGVDCWVQDVQTRVFATFGQPNWLAAYVVMLLSTLSGLLLGNRLATWERWYYYGAYALCLWTLLYTQSRSGFLALVCALGVLTLGLLARGWLRRHSAQGENLLNAPVIPWWRQAGVTSGLMLTGIILAAVAVSGTPYSPSLSSLVLHHRPTAPAATTPANQGAVVNRLDIGGTDSGEIRKIVWQGALNVWRRYPLFGSGVETFGYSYYQDRPVAHNMVSEWDFLYNKAHNEFLNFLATTGLVGLLAYLGMLITYAVISVRGFLRLTAAGDDDRALAVLGLAGAVVGLSVSNFFGFSTVVVTTLQFVAFGATVLLIWPAAPQPKPPAALSVWQLSLLILLGVVAFFPLKGVMDLYQADLLYASGKTLAQSGQASQAAAKLIAAIKLSPLEALYWDELAQLYAEAAASYAQAKTANVDLQALTGQAVAASDQALQLNRRQLNLYKTRARIFILLSQVDEKYTAEAIKTLQDAMTLSPTDPKLAYNLGLLYVQQGDMAKGITYLQQAVDLKPNYLSAVLELARQRWAQGDGQRAIDVLQRATVYEPNVKELRDLSASYSAELSKTPRPTKP